MIVLGHYQGGDYVRVFQLGEARLDRLIHQLKELEREFGGLRRIDAPRPMRGFILQDFIKRELDR